MRGESAVFLFRSVPENSIKLSKFVRRGHAVCQALALGTSVTEKKDSPCAGRFPGTEEVKPLRDRAGLLRLARASDAGRGLLVPCWSSIHVLDRKQRPELGFELLFPGFPLLTYDAQLSSLYH